MDPVILTVLSSVALQAVVDGGIRAYLAKRPSVVSAAIADTCGQFPDVVVEPSLRDWTASPSFDAVFESLRAGERDLEQDAAESLITGGGFFCGDETESTARRIVSAFLHALVQRLLESDQGMSVLASRIEELSSRDREHTDRRFDRIESLLLRGSLPSTDVALSEPPPTERPADPEHATLAGQIDLARDLIRDGNVTSARNALERLKQDIEDAPEDLRYRLLSNLGACALAMDEIDDGCAYLEEAHRLRPDDAASLANAAVAARLQGDPQKAVELARRSLELQRDDPHAASVLLEALWDAGEAEELEGYVSSEDWLAGDRQCALALARIRKDQGRFGEAVDLARGVVEEDSDDHDARLVLADCVLAAAQDSQGDASIDQRRDAENQASTALQLLEDTELHPQRLYALTIRAGARLQLDDLNGAMEDTESALHLVPDDPGLLYNKGIILLASEDPPAARAVFDLIDDPDTRAKALVPHAAAALWSDDSTAASELLRGNFSLEVGEWDDIRKAEILSEAEYQLGQDDTVGPLLDQALAQTPDAPQLLALAAMRAAVRGSSDSAEEMLMRAVDLSQESDRYEFRLRLASLYSREQRYSEAADQYLHVVGDDVLHPSAIALLGSLSNARRLREALSWAQAIRHQHPRPQKVALDIEAQILNYVGDLAAAADRRAAICSRDDATASDRFKLAQALYWRGEHTEARAIVRRIDATELRSQPRDLLGLAHLKRLLEEPAYLEDAYAARRYGIDDPSVHLGYFGLFISSERDSIAPETVEPGCAVLLRRGAEEEWWFILAQGEERHSDQELLPDADLAQALLGLRRGDTAQLQEGVGELSVVVVDIQDKYVRAFQDTAYGFSMRFPGNADLLSVPVAEDDMTNFFVAIDERDQFARELQRLYRDERVPFAFLCAHLGRPAPEMWRACTESGELRLRFGAGTEEETDRARELLCEADHLALDMMALLTIHELGIAETLRRRFACIAVPRAILDDLQLMVHEATMENRPGGYAGKTLDGTYTWVEMSEDAWAEHARFAGSLLSLAESFEPIASYPALDIDPDDLEWLAGAVSQAGVGAIFAGGAEPSDRPLLVSDDFGLAALARAFGASAVNTQAVLLELRRSEYLTDQEYSEHIARLARLNYRFVRIEAADVLCLLESNNYMTDESSRALIATLQAPECSTESAVRVAAELIAEIATRPIPAGQEALLVQWILDRLHRGREMTSALRECARQIDSRLLIAPPARERIGSLVAAWMRMVGG